MQTSRRVEPSSRTWRSAECSTQPGERPATQQRRGLKKGKKRWQQERAARRAACSAAGLALAAAALAPVARLLRGGLWEGLQESDVQIEDEPDRGQREGDLECVRRALLPAQRERDGEADAAGAADDVAQLVRRARVGREERELGELVEAAEPQVGDLQEGPRKGRGRVRGRRQGAALLPLERPPLAPSRPAPWRGRSSGRAARRRCARRRGRRREPITSGDLG